MSSDRALWDHAKATPARCALLLGVFLAPAILTLLRLPTVRELPRPRAGTTIAESELLLIQLTHWYGRYSMCCPRVFVTAIAVLGGVVLWQVFATIVRVGARSKERVRRRARIGFAALVVGMSGLVGWVACTTLWSRGAERSVVSTTIAFFVLGLALVASRVSPASGLAALVLGDWIKAVSIDIAMAAIRGHDLGTVVLVDALPVAFFIASAIVLARVKTSPSELRWAGLGALPAPSDLVIVPWSIGALVYQCFQLRLWLDRTVGVADPFVVTAPGRALEHSSFFGPAIASLVATVYYLRWAKENAGPQENA